MARREIKTRWYYDACTLDEELYSNILKTTTDKGNPVLAVLSHLALGEAYGNLFNKKGKEKMDAFTEFLDELKEKKCILVIGNDDNGQDDTCMNEIFEKIYGALPDGSLTDLMHMATAIKNNCSNFISNDRDFTGIPDSKDKEKKIKKIAQDNGIDNFCITWLKN